MSLSSTHDTPHFIIDSEDRLDGEIEDFHIKLGLQNNNNFDSVALIHAGIPKTYYNIDSINNEFTIIENGVSYTGYMTIGEYTSNNLPIQAKAAYDALSFANNGASPWTYTFIWDSFQHKWQITVTGHAGRPLVPATSGLSFTDHQTHDLLGFVDGETVNYNVSGVITSTNTANFNRTNYITVRSSIAQNLGNSDTNSQILARIPVKNVAFGDLIIFDVYQLLDATKRLTNNRSNIFSFSIYDDHESLLFLNGRDWFFTLLCYEYNKLGKWQLEELELIRRQREIAREQVIEQEEQRREHIAFQEDQQKQLLNSISLPDTS